MATDWGTIDWKEVSINTADLAKQGQEVLDWATGMSNIFVSLAGSAGIAGFVFDIVEDEATELSSVITDHYVETGSPVQDHIALRPEKITVKGLVGEYKDIVAGEKSFLQKTTEKLTTLASYLPVLSQAAGSIYNGLNNINNAESGKDLFNAATGLGSDLFEAYRNINIPQNEQQKAYIFFEALRNAKALFTVQTPFRYYTDMAIESIRSTQTGDTVDLSRFEVTLKKMRFVDTKIVELTKKESEKVENGETQGRLDQQKQSVQDEGTVSTAPATGKETVGGWFKGNPEVVEIPRDAPDWEAQWDAAQAEGKLPW